MKNKEVKKIKLLFITQKIHQNDDDLAFVILWIKEFIRQEVDVRVICLEKEDFDDSFPVYSLGKEKGYGKITRIIRFLKFIFTLDYDRVFVHMNPEYVTLGGWYWFLVHKPVYLWYTHYTMHIHLWLSGILCKRMLAATPQSLPQYNASEKKIVTGHGIDVDFWLANQREIKQNNNTKYNLVSVHRICRSKRLELVIRSLKYLPDAYTLAVYGRDVEKDYYQEMKKLVRSENLDSRVSFKGPIPMGNLRDVYSQFRVMINMASETIDKTVLEGMLFGIYPVTTAKNAEAIGLPESPIDDRPETIARFILDNEWEKYDMQYLQNIVKEKHSLPVLVKKMSTYIKKGV